MAEEKLTEGQTTNSLLTAMDMIAESRINGLQFDKTELAEIVDITDRNNGDYVVFNGSARYHAYTENTSYTLGTKVYVSIPNNDMSGQKTIVRKYIDKNYNRALNYTLPLNQYTPGTSNILEGLNEQYQLLANWNKAENKMGEQSIIVFESGDLSDSNIQGFKYMGLSADFQTLMGGQKITKGNYGLKVYVRYEYQINEEPTEQIICYALDTSNMVGSLYNFFTGFEQQALFELPDYMAGRVIRQIVVEFFQDGNFENIGGIINVQPDDMGLLPPDNIIVKNISLQFGDAPIETTEVDKVTISAINGLFYDSAYGDNDLNTRNIRLKWYHRNPNTADENHQYGTLELMDKVKKIPNESGLTFNAFIWWLHDSQRTWDEVIENQKTFTERLENLKELQNVYLNEINPDAGLDEYGNPVKFENDDEFSNYWFICDETGHNEHFHQLIDSFSLKEERDYIYNNITNYFELKQSGISKIKRKIILTPIGDTHECEWGYGWNLIDENTEYDEFSIDFQPDIKAQNCKVKCVIEYGPLNEDGILNRESQHYTVVESNILEFNNKSIVPDSLTWDAAIGLTVQFNDKSNGIYPLYNGSDGRILNINDATKDRVLEADIKSSYNGRSYLNGNETLIWKIPKYNTMIEVSSDSMEIMNGQLLAENDDIITKTIFETYSGVIGEYDNNYWYLMYSSNYGDKDNLYQRYQYEFQKRIDEYLERLKKIDSFIEFTEEDVQNYTESTNTPEKAQKYIENIRGLIDKRDAQSDIRTIYNKLRYRIEQYMRPERTNNTITCYLIKNSVMIKSDVTMRFTQHGTAGTDYTFTLGLGKLYNIDEDENGKQVWTEIGGTDSALTIGENGWREIVFNLYNAKNEIIDIPLELRSDIIYKWKTSDESGFLWGQDLIHGTPQKISYKINDDNTRIALKTEDSDINQYQGGLVLKATLTSGTISATYGEKSYNLQGINFTQILPIPIRSGEEKYTVEGVDFITYNDNGGSPSYYKDALVLEQNGEVIDGTNFKLWYQNKEKINGNIFLQWEKVSETIFDENNNRIIKYNTINSGFPSINEVKLNDGQVVYKLVPYPIYFTGIENTPLFLGYYEGEVLRYISPIVILQNQYQVPILNSWDGNLLVDSDNNRVMAATMAAGHKNDNNTFTGVIMGDVEHQVGDSKETITGLYGYHEGAQSFGFKEDGTAFIGKSGAGRLYVNGDEGAIESGNYASSEGKTGTKIDLEDGSIDMNNSAYHTNIHLDTNGNVNKPYFRISVPKIPIEEDNNEIIKQSLMQIDNTNYYLQTADYDGSSKGLRIDLKNGTFDSKGRLTINGAKGSNITFGDAENYITLGINQDKGAYFNMESKGNGTGEQIDLAANEVWRLANEIAAYFWNKKILYDEVLKTYKWDSTSTPESFVFNEPNEKQWYNHNGSSWIIEPSNNNYYDILIKFLDEEKKLPKQIGVIFDKNKTASDYLKDGTTVQQITVTKDIVDNKPNYHFTQIIEEQPIELNFDDYLFYKQIEIPVYEYEQLQNGSYDTSNVVNILAYRTLYQMITAENISSYVDEDIDANGYAILYIKNYDSWKEPVEEWTANITYDKDEIVFKESSNEENSLLFYKSLKDNNQGNDPNDSANSMYWESATQEPLITDLERPKFDLYIELADKASTNAYKKAYTVYTKAQAEVNDKRQKYEQAEDNYEQAQNNYTEAVQAVTNRLRERNTTLTTYKDTICRYGFNEDDRLLQQYQDTHDDTNYANYDTSIETNYAYFEAYKNIKENSENEEEEENTISELNYIECWKALQDISTYISNDTQKIDTAWTNFYNGNKDSWYFKPKNNNNVNDSTIGFRLIKKIYGTEDNAIRFAETYKEWKEEKESLFAERKSIYFHFLKQDSSNLDIDSNTLTEEEQADYQENYNYFNTYYIPIIQNGDDIIPDPDETKTFINQWIIENNDAYQGVIKDIVTHGQYYIANENDELVSTTIKRQLEAYENAINGYENDINAAQAALTDESRDDTLLSKFKAFWINWIDYGTKILQQEYDILATTLDNYDRDQENYEDDIQSLKDKYSYTNNQQLIDKRNAYRSYDEENKNMTTAQKNLVKAQQSYEDYINEQQYMDFQRDDAEYQYFLRIRRDLLIADYLSLERLEEIENELNILETKTIHYDKVNDDYPAVNPLIKDFEEPFITDEQHVRREFKLYTKYSLWAELQQEQEQNTALKNEIQSNFTQLEANKESYEKLLFKSLKKDEVVALMKTSKANTYLYKQVTKEITYNKAKKKFVNYIQLTGEEIDNGYQSKVKYFKLMDEEDYTDLQKDITAANKKITTDEPYYSQNGGNTAYKLNVALNNLNAATAVAEAAKKNFEKYNNHYKPLNLIDLDGNYDRNKQYYLFNTQTNKYELINRADLNQHLNELVYEYIDFSVLQTELENIISQKIINASLTYNKYLKKIEDYKNNYEKFLFYNQRNVNNSVKLNNNEKIRLQLGDFFSVDEEGYLKASAGEMENITVKTLNFEGYTDEKTHKNYPGARGIKPKWMTFVTNISGDIEYGKVSVTVPVEKTVNVPYSYTDHYTTTTKVDASGLYYARGVPIKGSVVGGGANLSVWTGPSPAFADVEGDTWTLHVTGTVVNNLNVPVTRNETTSYHDIWYGESEYEVVKKITLTVEKVSMWALTNNSAVSDTIEIS